MENKEKITKTELDKVSGGSQSSKPKRKPKQVPKPGPKLPPHD